MRFFEPVRAGLPPQRSMNALVLGLQVLQARSQSLETIENAKSFCHWADMPGKETSAIHQPGYRPTGVAWSRLSGFCMPAAGKLRVASDSELCMRSQIHQGWPGPFCVRIALCGAVGLSAAHMAHAQLVQRAGERFAEPAGARFNGTSAAQNVDDRSLSERAVFVTATRSSSPLGTALADHQVIDREHIEAAMGMTLVELIGSLPGVQWVNAGGHGKASSLLLRGTESRHVLLLIDGVRFSSATLGLASLENLPLDAIERIELVRGPMSALYGSDAVGGVIQVFTRAGAANSPGMLGASERYSSSLQSTWGSRGYASTAWLQRWKSESFDASVQLSGLRSDALSATNAREPWGSFDPDADRYRQSSANAQAGWDIAPGLRLDMSALRVEGRTAIDDGLGTDSRAALLSQIGQLGLQAQVSKAWHTRIRWSEAVDGYNTLRTASPWTELGETRSRSQQWIWENQLALSKGLLQVHAEQQYQDVSRPGEPFEQTSRSIRGYGLGWIAQEGPHQWQVNLRRDENSQFGSENTGALAYGFRLSTPWRLRVAIGTSFVAPSFNQLYYPGFGNPALQAERGRSREWGLNYQQGDQHVSISYFQQRIRGYITAGPIPENLPYSDIEGLSLSGSRRFAGLQWSVAYDWLDPRNTSIGSPFEGNLLPRRARQQFRLASQGRSGPWTFGGQWQVLGDRYDDQSNTLRLPGYARLDVFAHRAIASDWRLSMRVGNLTDRRYETAYGYNQAGRALYVGLSYTMR